MLLMIMVACCRLQLLTELKVDKAEISTDGATEVSWPGDRPELAFPRVTKVFSVMVWMLDPRVANTYGIKHTYDKIKLRTFYISVTVLTI